MQKHYMIISKIAVYWLPFDKSINWIAKQNILKVVQYQWDCKLMKRVDKHEKMYSKKRFFVCQIKTKNKNKTKYKKLQNTKSS